MSSTKFVFFWPIGKTRWGPWPLIGRDILDFSSETAERNSTKLDKKQDLNVLYQVCIFRRSVNKNGRPGRFLKKVAHCTQVHDMWPFGPLVYARRGLRGMEFWGHLVFVLSVTLWQKTLTFAITFEL